MSGISYDVNRSVYLGRRDCFIEKVSDLFQQCLKETSPKKRLRNIGAMLYYLESALEQSVLASKSSKAVPMEDPFIFFVRMVLFYLYSAHAIVENEIQINNKKSPLRQFFSQNDELALVADIAQSSKQVFEDISHLFRMVEEPYHDLKKNLIDRMDPKDRARYSRAYQNLEKHVTSSSHHRHVFTYARTFYPTHAMKYG